MKETVAALLVPFVAIAAACAGAPPSAGPEPCSAEWFAEVERRVQSSDADGHGPDLGSLEWKSVVEFRLGIRGAPETPPPDSDAWCRHIEERLGRRPGAGIDAPPGSSSFGR